MSKLAERSCEACRADAPVVAPELIDELMTNLSGWEIISIKGTDHLQKIYSFSNFVEALAYTNRVGEIAEGEGHHPEIVTEWARVRVSWWTHKINGLHLNDFIMAARCDQL